MSVLFREVYEFIQNKKVNSSPVLTFGLFQNIYPGPFKLLKKRPANYLLSDMVGRSLEGVRIVFEIRVRIF